MPPQQQDETETASATAIDGRQDHTNDNSREPCVRNCITPYDSDDEPPQDLCNARLNWRLDPSESLSDWTVEIESLETDMNLSTQRETKVYHVHRSVLAIGSRKSAYFASLFQSSDNFAESKSRSSRIPLKKIAADAFPQMLDYMYSPDKQLQVTTENATALHHLGQYFEIRLLRWDAKQFWKEDLKAENCDIYYEHAMLLHDEKIHAAVPIVCEENILSISKDHGILRVTPHSFWERILLNSTEAEISTKLHLSVLIAEFLYIQEDIDAVIFHKLTQEERLPEIDSMAALKLIVVEERLIADKSINHNHRSRVHERCMLALTSKWDTVNVEDSEMRPLLQALDPVLLSEIFTKSISNVQSVVETERKKYIQVRDWCNEWQVYNAKRDEERKVIEEDRDKYLAELKRFTPLDITYCGSPDSNCDNTVVAQIPSELPKYVSDDSNGSTDTRASISNGSKICPVYIYKPA